MKSKWATNEDKYASSYTMLKIISNHSSFQAVENEKLQQWLELICLDFPLFVARNRGWKLLERIIPSYV